jgi:hypothetical protein
MSGGDVAETVDYQVAISAPHHFLKRECWDLRVPEFANALFQSQPHESARRTGSTHEVDEDIGIPPFVGLAPTISADHPSPELGYTQVLFS